MSNNVKTAFTVILITLGLAVALGIALYFYQIGQDRWAAAHTIDKIQIETCKDASKVDKHWRLVTGSVPSPTTKWRIYSTDGIICHVLNDKIRTFAIDETLLKRTGCTAGDYALYCRDNAQPERHPRYQAIMDPS